jgi:thiamine-monophosphate kinase
MTAPRGRRTAAIDEREFHDWLGRHLTGPARGLLPLGDDAAALRVPPGRVAVLSTDSLVEGTHFLPDSPPARIGAAAANVSLSDLAAKGAQPAGLLLAVIVPPGTHRAWVQALVRGADRAGAAGGAPLVGGDTKPGAVRAVVSTVLGWSRPDRLAPRTGAKPGDRLLTTGPVGRGGLAALRLAHAPRSSPKRRRALVDLLAVQPRLREGRALAEFAHAMLDTSDGLADASWLMARASGCRVTIEEDRLPFLSGLRALPVPPPERRAIAFYGGDYELLAAVPAASVQPARTAVRRAGGQLLEVGRIEPGRDAWLESAGRCHPLPAGGWRPFSRRGPGLMS